MQCNHIGHVALDAAFVEHEAELCKNFTYHALRLSNIRCTRCGAIFEMSGRTMVAIPLSAVAPFDHLEPPPVPVDIEDLEAI